MPRAQPALAEAPPPRTEDLIAHILDRYHAAHRRDLAEAIQLAVEVEQTDALNQGFPLGLADLLMLINDDLEDHQQKEEVVLFPLMLSGAATSLAGPLTRMQLDHDDLALQLDELRILTRGYAPPANASGSWRRLYEICGRLDAELEIHVALEKNVLFPRFSGALAH